MGVIFPEANVRLNATKKKAYDRNKGPEIRCHQIIYEDGSALGNAHTHGMENYGKKNLCLALNLCEEKTSKILNTVADLVCDPDEEMDPRAIHVVEDDHDQEWLRFILVPVMCFDEIDDLIVLADRNNKFPFDIGCEEPYCDQLMSHHDIKVYSKFKNNNFRIKNN